MTVSVILLLLLVALALAVDAALAADVSLHNCHPQVLSTPLAPSALSINISYEASKILQQLEAASNSANFSAIAQHVLSSFPDISTVILSSSSSSSHPMLARNVSRRLKVFPNRTTDNDAYWKAFDNGNWDEAGWVPPFRDCYHHHELWMHAYVAKSSHTVGVGVGLFVRMSLNQCDRNLAEIFGGQQCDNETTECEPLLEFGLRRGGYRCRCRRGYFFPNANASWNGFSGFDIENGRYNSNRCMACPEECETCEPGGLCLARRDLLLKTAVVGLQLGCMGISVILALIVFKHRKCKTIASGMWTILETILLGIFLLYSTVVLRFFEPSVLQCLLEPWARELGFVICYGAIILKLYRHLIEFRTRKAHRWVVKDTDLLKYLCVMVISVLAYMAAYTATALNFLQENYSLLITGRTTDGELYQACKPLWWDYVTESGELTILIFGLHLSYASRNATTQFQERKFLCAAICIELTVSGVFYVARVLYLPSLHPDLVLIAHCVRSQLTASVTMLLLFVPKLWYQQKQARSLAQEYSCRFPVDAFKDVNAHGPLTSNNSDADVGEVTLADMSPDDIRAELKRLYMQLEILKNKTIRTDNPHISKRRGGRKVAHRRFSLQKKGSRERNLHGGKHREKQNKQTAHEETTEPEPSRTPEDSVCSVEGPSAIYSELPSGPPSSGDHK